MKKQITEAKTNKSHMWIFEKLAFSIDFKHTYVCNFEINSEIEFYKEFCIDVEEAIDFYFPCMQPIYLNFLLLSEAFSFTAVSSIFQDLQLNWIWPFLHPLGFLKSSHFH